MTAAVAIAVNGDVVVGMDSCTVGAGGATFDNAEKAPVRFDVAGHGLVIATAGLDAIASELTAGRWTPPDPTGLDPIGFLRVCAVSLRDHFTAEPLWSLSKDKDEGSLEGHFIAGYRGVAVEIDGAFAVMRPRSGEVAIGTGRDFVLGALAATKGQPAEERVQVALEAAAYFQQDVAAPFSIRWADR